MARAKRVLRSAGVSTQSTGGDQIPLGHLWRWAGLCFGPFQASGSEKSDSRHSVVGDSGVCALCRGRTCGAQGGDITLGTETSCSSLLPEYVPPGLCKDWSLGTY